MSEVIEYINFIFELLWLSLTNLALRIHPIYMVCFIVVGVLVYALRKKNIEPDKKSFWRWLFPPEMYLHKSHMTDIQLFIVGRFFVVTTIVANLITPVFFGMATIAILESMLGPSSFATPHLSYIGILGVSLLLVLVDDFCTYWVHRIHHENRVLWPFHAVHHSAEIMTPVTVYRKHPVYDFLSLAVKNPASGIAQGLILYFLTDDFELALLAGTNVFLVASNAITGNFRHSHVWISFGRFWEHIFISPAQHQIHHSMAVEHHDKNYGEIFAIWDWMFGTLYVPEKEENIQFGLADAKGVPIPQPHYNLSSAIFEPFVSSYKAMKKFVKNEFKTLTRIVK